jgi:hypothetical protein
MTGYHTVPFLCGIRYFPQLTHPHASWLPQVSLCVKSTIHDISSSVTLTQTFVNPSEAIEKSDYVFPLYGFCTVVAFHCIIGNRRICSVVREKEEAGNKHIPDVDWEEAAGFPPSVFNVSLGNIPAGETVKVELQYIMELQRDAEVGGLRFTIPANIASRYGDALKSVGTPLGQRASVASEDEGIKISISVTMSSDIYVVQSPSHSISTYLGTHVENSPDSIFNPKIALATLSQRSTELSSDFVLIVKCVELFVPQAFLETHPTIPNSNALMITLIPKFAHPIGPKPEIVFVADCSYSMSIHVGALRSALFVFLKSLPVGILFNICSFGSSHTFLWGKSQPYTADTFNQAQKHVQTMCADYGGTEVLTPIMDTVSRRNSNIPLDIMVLTDGDVERRDQVISYVKQVTAPGDIRVFGLGIGPDVSHALVEGMSTGGGGFAQIVTNERDGFEGKLVWMLKGGLSSHFKDYRLEWDGKHTNAKIFLETGLPSPAIIQTPHKLPPLFPFSCLTAYVIFSGSTLPPSSVWLRGSTPSGDNHELEIPVQVLREKSRTIHQLATRRILQSLEEGTSHLHGRGVMDDTYVKSEGTRVGVLYGVPGKWTSFVVVETKSDGKSGDKRKDWDMGPNSSSMPGSFRTIGTSPLTSISTSTQPSIPEPFVFIPHQVTRSQRSDNVTAVNRPTLKHHGANVRYYHYQTGVVDIFFHCIDDVARRR